MANTNLNANTGGAASMAFFTVLPAWVDGIGIEPAGQVFLTASAGSGSEAPSASASVLLTQTASASRAAHRSSTASRFSRVVSTVASDAIAPTSLLVAPGATVSSSDPASSALPTLPANPFAASSDGNATQEQAPSSAAAAAGPGDLATESNLWPYSFNLMVGIALLLYALARSRGLARAIASRHFARGWRLSSSFKPARNDAHSGAAQRKLPYPLPARRTRRIEAKLRSAYNAYLLPTVPRLNLTAGQCAVLLGYTGCVVAATFVQSADPAENIVRSGRIAVAQFPVLFLLATKNNMLSALVGKSYVKLNFIHRFAGRSVIVCSVLHSALYVKKLADIGKLAFDRSPIQSTGLAGLAACLLIMLTSLRPVRRAAYRLFLASHIIGWISLLVATHMHVKWARPWILVSLGVFALDIAYRLAGTRVRTARLVAREGGVTQITVDGLDAGWRAGQHVWVRRLTARHAWEVHPFSIANSPELPLGPSYDSAASAQPPRGLTLYAKSCGDWTASLHEAAVVSGDFQDGSDADAWSLDEKHDPFALKETVFSSIPPRLAYSDASPLPAHTHAQVQVALDGPYGSSWSDACASLGPSGAESVLLLAGGSGITFVLNALEELVALSAAGRSPAVRVKIVYAVRGRAQHAHFISVLEKLADEARRTTFLQLEVLVFDSALRRGEGENPFEREREEEAAATAAWDPFADPHSGRMERGRKLSIKRKEGGDAAAPVSFHAGRPNLTTCLNHLLNDARPSGSTTLGGGVALLSCGPAELIAAARRAAADCHQGLAYRAGGVTVHSETFGW